MKGFPRKLSFVQYPPGAFPFLLEFASQLRVDSAEDRLRAIDKYRHVVERLQRLDALELDAEVPRPNAV